MTDTQSPHTGEQPFKREERYIVIKRKHLDEYQEAALRAHLDSRGIGTVECVVVESDWPEYETVWKMIEDRCTGLSHTVEQVTEADRVAAAELIEAYWQGAGEEHDAMRKLAQSYRAGHTQGVWAEAFARHRLTTAALHQGATGNA